MWVFELNSFPYRTPLQAVDDVKKGFIKVEQKSYQLQKLAEQKKMSTVSLARIGCTKPSCFTYRDW